MINFRAPKFIIPLFAIPVLAAMNYAYKSSVDHKMALKEKEINQTKQAGLDGTIPGPSKEIQGKNLSDKFDAVGNKYKKQSDISAIGALDVKDNTDPELKTAYTDQERRTIDSIQEDTKKKLLEDQKKNNDRRNKANRPNTFASYSGDNSADASGYSVNKTPAKRLEDANKALVKALQQMNKKTHPDEPPYLNKQNQGGSPEPVRPSEDQYKRNLDFYKKQMDYIDSLQHHNDPAWIAEHRPKNKDTVKKDPPVEVRKVDNINDRAFNTVVANRTDRYIKAIIDENIKVQAGSRVRLRLMEDVLVGNSLLKKDNYIYGIVSGFRLTRVTIAITTILQDERIFPVKLTIYDNDGLEGIYVPGSNFREFSKNLGSSEAQGITYTDQSQSITTNLISNLFSSSTTAASKLIAKDKAQFKYNTVVYLVTKN